YVSLEPCSHFGKTPPCAELLVAFRFKRCVIGCVDPFAKVQGKGIAKLKEAGIEVTVGVLAEECQKLNKRFFAFHGKGRPYIMLKWAQTQDGYIDALRENDNTPALAISNALSIIKVHKLRSEYQAILVGKNTDRLDHPSLTVRHWSGPNPKRLVIDKPIPELLSELHQEGIQSLLVEGGAKLLNSFIQAGLWDEIQVEIGNRALGEKGVQAPVLPDAEELYEETFAGHKFLHIFAKSN
ncbi:MAG: dihydrofolate reductase family protein, partial [Bacteroidaceae bacterium]|nr:dihydrofolate reductase family protein [Bacteroidaceae bacterium]